MCINSKVRKEVGVPSNVLKYIVLVALCALLTIMASNAAVGIYMTYALPIVFSIFYYDKMDLCQYFGHKKLNFSPSITYAERIIS